MSDRWRRFDWIAVGVIVLITAFHVWGVRLVPFHPDETSLLYQSADLEAWLHDPLSLAWDPTRTTELSQVYRTLNPPLPKVVLGLGRRMAGFGPESVAVDWDWSKTWDENQGAGAVPGERLLTAARLANVMLVPFSLLFLYLSGKKIGGRTTAILAVVLMGTNTLVLLHTRRAMAEASVVFGVSLAALGFVQARERPWLAGLGAATAALSKLSAAALAPIGLLLVVWPDRSGPHMLRRMGSRLLVYLGILVGEVLVFDPLLWRRPLQAIAAVWRARLDFSAVQVRQIGAVVPTSVLQTPTERLASLIGNLFIVPPQFAEVGNYVQQTQPQVQAYLAVPGDVLLRGVVAGGIVLLICLVGMSRAMVRLRRPSSTSGFALAALLAASVAQALALYLAVQLPFQRYYMPLVPFACLWTAYGLVEASAPIGQLLRLSPRHDIKPAR